MVRTGGQEERAVEREAPRDEAAVRADGEGAERGVVGTGGVGRGGQGGEEGEGVEERSGGAARVVGVGECRDEAGGEGEWGRGGDEAGGEEVRVELQEAAERRRWAGGEDGQEAGRRRRRHGLSEMRMKTRGERRQS